MNMAIRHICATGHFNDACNKWTKLIRVSPALNTWQHFKNHFQAARILVKQNSNAKVQFQAANQLISQQESKFAELQAANQRSKEESQRSTQQLAAQSSYLINVCLN